MPDRPDQFGYGVTIPATTARLVELAAEIMGEPSPEEFAFLHSVLAQCFLPYRQPPGDARYYHRTNGNNLFGDIAGFGRAHGELGFVPK